jgi:gamma-glutamyl hercynylcysteine S-oxide hydrolase
MCRHLAYLGPPAPLSGPLLDAPHALVVQAWAPADMRGGGTINADGFGVGWFPAAGVAPVQYRCATAIWADAQLPRLAAATTAPAWLAAVRSATPGMPLSETACAPFAGGAPFASGGWLFSLNGRIAGWPETVAGLATRLPVTDLLTMEAPTDSVLVWALLRRRLAGGEDPASAVAATVAEVAAAAPGSRLNLLLSDATTIVATTLTHSLSVWRGPDAVLVSSEPLDDDPAWRPVPDGRLVVATPQAVKISPLLLEGAP